MKPYRRLRRNMALVLLTVLLALGAGTSVFAAGTGPEASEAGSAVKSRPDVLFLSSYSPDWPEVAMQMQGLQNALEDSSNQQFLFMDTKHISSAEAEQYTCAHLKTLCGETHFDAVVVGDDAALNFAVKYRAAFFADVPIVFMGINSAKAANAASALPLITGTIEDLPFEQTLRLAVSIFPHASRVLSISDGTESGKAVRLQLNDVERAFPQLSFEDMDSSQLTRSEIASRLSACGDDTILLYLVMTRDGEGNTYSARQAAEFLSEAAAVPIFRADEMGMGNGFFGGCVISYLQMGEQVGETVKKILNGAAPDEIEIKGAGARYEFDYNQLRRFGIAESSLPKDSTILNRPATFWSENRQTLIPSIMIISVLLLMLIMSVWNGRKRAVLQRKLADSQKLYRTAANSVDLVVWGYDPSTRQITMSFDSDFTRHVCEVRGFSQVLENGPDRQAAVIFENDRPALLGMYRQIDAGAETAECQYGFLWEGVPAYRRAKATSVYDEKTRRRTVVCISTDITAEHRMQELYEKELQYPALALNRSRLGSGTVQPPDSINLLKGPAAESNPRPGPSAGRRRPNGSALRPHQTIRTEKMGLFGPGWGSGKRNVTVMAGTNILRQSDSDKDQRFDLI